MGCSSVAGPYASDGGARSQSRQSPYCGLAWCMAFTAVIEPIRRAFVVLEALNRQRSTTLTVLAAETGLPRPTLGRLLQTLMALGYASPVARDAGYRLPDPL